MNVSDLVHRKILIFIYFFGATGTSFDLVKESLSSAISFPDL